MAKGAAKYRKRKQAETDLHELLVLAATHVKTNSKLSSNAVRDVFRLNKQLRIPIPLTEKRKLCKVCYTYLLPGVTSTHRIAKGRIIITCKSCGTVKRLQYRR